MSKHMATFLSTLFIGVMISSLFQITVTKIINYQSASKSCAQWYDQCDPGLLQPCCNPNNKCINLDRTIANKFEYRCIKYAQLGDDCKHFSDCRAIIEGKCSEDGTCACNSFSSEYNSTICLYPTIREEMIPEIAAHYYYDYYTQLYSLKQDFQSQTGLNRQSRTKFNEYCNQDHDCFDAGYPNSGFICDIINEGQPGKECKCPKRKQFDMATQSCEKILGPSVHYSTVESSTRLEYP